MDSIELNSLAAEIAALRKSVDETNRPVFTGVVGVVVLSSAVYGMVRFVQTRTDNHRNRLRRNRV